MNPFDELMGLDPVVADQEMAGFFSKVFKGVKKAVKKVGDVAKKVVQSPIGGIALTAVTGLAGGTLLGAGLKSTSLVSKGIGALNTAKSYLKKNAPVVYEVGSAINKERLDVRRQEQQLKQAAANAARAGVAPPPAGVPLIYHQTYYEEKAKKYQDKSRADAERAKRIREQARQQVLRSQREVERQRAEAQISVSKARAKQAQAEAKRAQVAAIAAQESAKLRTELGNYRRNVAKAQELAFRNANRIINAGEGVVNKAIENSNIPAVREAVGILRGQGKTDAEIRDAYLTSRTFRNQAVPVATEVTFEAIYADLVARGVPEQEAIEIAEQEAARLASEAVGQVQKEAATGAGITKLLPFAIPAGLFLLSQK